MADSKAETYKVQVISGRYIRAPVLDTYVSGKVAEFGSKWKRVFDRDNRITFTALRKLTDDELDQLQETSNPKTNQDLFV